MNVRLCAPLLAALSLSPLALADTPAQRCQDLLESGMRMAGWEQHCQFNAGVAPALRTAYMQAGCPGIIKDDTVDRTVRQLDAELNGQIQRAGSEAAFCTAVRPAYEDIVGAMPRGKSTHR